MLNSFFFFESRTVYEIMWNEYCRARQATMTIRCIRTAYWIPQATNAHTGCVTLTAFPLKQRSMEAPQRHITCPL